MGVVWVVGGLDTLVGVYVTHWGVVVRAYGLAEGGEEGAGEDREGEGE